MMRTMRMKKMTPVMKLEPGMIVRIQGKRTRYKIVGYQGKSVVFHGEPFPSRFVFQNLSNGLRFTYGVQAAEHLPLELISNEYAAWLMKYGCGHYNQHDATKIQHIVHNFKRGLISADEAVYCLSQISRGKPIA